MSEDPSIRAQASEVFQRAAEQQAEGAEILRRLTDVASVKAVFAEPVQSGEYTVITASENYAGLGFGGGVGGGFGGDSERMNVEHGDHPSEDEAAGFGGGSGGGGGSKSRPVAALIIGPDGVRVEPIVDVTKFMIALFTTLGSMALMFGQMRKRSRG